MSVATETQTQNINTKPPLQHLVIIRPLGLLYGSSGRFLSPENLVGRSGVSFPPSAATVSGIFAHQLRDEPEKLSNLQLAGAFWALDNNEHEDNKPEHFYVPTPLNCLVKEDKIQHTMSWREGKWQTYYKETGKWDIPPNDKYEKGTWINISNWDNINNKPEVIKKTPWEFLPHLHPRLKHIDRTVDTESQQGSLFLENAVQLDPDACLVYLSNTQIPDGWYRFGGEGHMVEIECRPLGETAQGLLDRLLQHGFALITPAIWGSNRLSYRAPQIDSEEALLWGDSRVEALLTGRPKQMRHRLGNKKEGHQNNQPKLLSRGRYAVPGGSVYILDKPMNQTWHQWDEAWFPHEGYSYKRWGCGLALPLDFE